MELFKEASLRIRIAKLKYTNGLLRIDRDLAKMALRHDRKIVEKKLYHVAAFCIALLTGSIIGTLLILLSYYIHNL